MRHTPFIDKILLLSLSDLRLPAGQGTQMKLLLTVLMATVLDKVIYTSQDDTWRYNMESKSDPVYKEYVAHEMQPHTAVLCPAGFFIVQLSYHFNKPEKLENAAKLPLKGVGQRVVLNLADAISLRGQDMLKQKELLAEKGDDKRSTLIEQDTEEFRRRTDVHLKHGPCPPLIYCVGFQACLFRFSIEFCRHDPIPGYRKVLNIRLTCTNASKFEEHARVAGLISNDIRWPEQTVHIKYNSSLERGLKDVYNSTNLMRIMHEKRDVFGRSCPDLRLARSLGYKGDCHKQPQHMHDQVDKLWKNLGRVFTNKCASRLLQVFCSYQYNPSGACVPPFLSSSQDGQKIFNFLSLPRNGIRPDLTKYKAMLRRPHLSLIPARIGFAILGHSAPDTLVQLLELIYRPQHYYVFHIDFNADRTRQELRRLLSLNLNASNIRVLPKDRSHASTWGAFEIQRAEFETYEELLRMGVWDFSVLLSGSDLPLRSVDDMAASLASHRGYSFVRINTKLNVSGDIPIKFAWHACDGHLFEVTQRSPITTYDLYSHSAWVVLSREATELVISEDRPSFINDIHYFLSSSLIADESYIGTVLLASHLKQTVVSRIIHFLRPFEPHNVINLCRHSDTTDTCGQGPGIFIPGDLPRLQLFSHHLFFARKFNLDLDDMARVQMVKNYRSDAYKNSMTQFITRDLLWHLARMTIGSFPRIHQVASVGRLHDWRIVSRLMHTMPCCHLLTQRGDFLVEDFRLWMEYTVVDVKKKEHNATATFVPTPSFRCFPGGSIRAMHVTTRANPLNSAAGPLDVNIPLPGLPAGGTAFWIQLFFDLSGMPEPSCSNEVPLVNPKWKTFLKFPPETELRKRNFHILTDVTVTDVNGVPRCGGEMVLELGPKLLQTHGPALKFSHPVHCPNITAGLWTVTIRERFIPHPFEYSIQVIVMQEVPLQAYERQAIHYIEKLWKVDEVMVDDPATNNFYKTDYRQDMSEKAMDAKIQTFKLHESKISDIDHQRKGVINVENISFIICFLVGIIVFLLMLIVHLSSSKHCWKGSFTRPILTRRRGAMFVVSIIVFQIILYKQLESHLPSGMPLA